MTEELSENTEMITPGLMLSEARVSLQQTPKDIAKKLNLRESLILAIENNDFDDTVSMTFTRGYLKAYAKLVRVDETLILQAFDYWNDAEQQQLKMQSFSHQASRRSHDNWLSVFSYLVVLVLLVMAVLWWFQRQDNESSGNVLPLGHDLTVSRSSSGPADTDLAQQAPEDSGEAVVELDDGEVATLDGGEVATLDGGEVATLDGGEVATLDDGGAATLDEPAAVVVDDSDAAVVEQAVGEGDITAGQTTLVSAAETGINDREQAPAADGPVPEGEGDGLPLAHLELRFSGDCWINIRDARDERVAIGTKGPTDNVSVYGVAPFTIKLGKPEVVSILLEGEQREIPYVPRGRIANFELALKADGADD